MSAGAENVAVSALTRRQYCFRQSDMLLQPLPVLVSSAWLALPAAVCVCPRICFSGFIIHPSQALFMLSVCLSLWPVSLSCAMSQGSNTGRLASCCLHSAYAGEGNLRGLVRQLSIDQFENEGRRVSMGTDSVQKPQRTPLFERHSSDPGVHKVHPART